MMEINIPMGNYTLELGAMVKNGYDIFDFDYPFYDPAHKKEFEIKFIQHFRYNEIGQETIQRFKEMLKDVLFTNYPKYKHYYDTSEKAKNLNWEYNKDYTEENKRVTDRTNNSNSSNQSSTSGHTSSWTQTDDIVDNTSKFSDTPQGQLNNLDNYLTNATIDRTEDVMTANTDATDTSDNSSASASQSVGKDVEIETIRQYGNIGVTTSADLVDSWNKMAKWFNIDQIIFDDCEDLFMQVY